jgi:TRAP-type uncharacterized transport system substrate-binding protein
MRILFVIAAILFASNASAQAKQFVVGQGSITGTYGKAFSELSSACSTESLPLTPAFPDGKGDGAGNLEALTNSQAQAAFVRNDVIFWQGQGGQLGHVKTLFTLWPEQIHLIAKTQTTVAVKKYGFNTTETVTLNTISDLNGRRLGAVGANQITANVLKAQTSINFEIVPLADAKTAVEALDKGLVEAIIFTAGKPAPVVTKLNGNFKLLAIPADVAKKVAAVYSPTTLTYSNLSGAFNVPSVQAESIFVTKVYNTSSKIQQLSELRACFYKRLDELKDEGSPLWQPVDSRNHGKWPWYELPTAPAAKAGKTK